MAAGNFRKGAEAAQEASKGAQFARTNYFGIDENEQAIIRLLSGKDEWITVDQHQNIPTKGKPADWPKEAKWPERMGAVCRGDVAWEGIYHDGSKEGRKNACFICSHIVGTGTGKQEIKKPGARTWAMACLREEVIGDGSEALGGPAMKGKVLGIRDKTREVTVTDKDGKATGDSKTERAVVVVNQGWKNFFTTLNSFAIHYKSATDRDYYVKRTGKETDTDYPIIPADPIVMPNGEVFDTSNPEHAKKYEITPDTLGDIVAERASDEFYARFFDTRVASPPLKKKEDSGDGGQTAVAAQAPERPTQEADAGALAALADRVKTYGSNATAPAAPAATEPAPAAPQEPAPAAPEATAAQEPAPAAPGPQEAPGGAPSTGGSPVAGKMMAFD